ncbi:MAG TPA: hypothetical protein VF320_10445, partial [Acidimicrobiales bacterium]
MSAPGHRRPVGHARIEAARQAKIRAARRRAHRPYYIAGAVALVVVFVGSILLIRSDHGTSVATTSDTTQTTGASKEFAYGTAPCAPSSPPAAPKLDFAGTNGFMSCLKPGSKYTATFDTSAGTVAVDLDTANVPGTVNNCTQLAGYSY